MAIHKYKAILVTKDNQNQLTSQFSDDNGKPWPGFYLVVSFGEEHFTQLSKANYEQYCTPTNVTLENGWWEVSSETAL